MTSAVRCEMTLACDFAYAAEGALEDGDSVLLPDDAERWFTTDGMGHHAPLDERLH